MVITSLTFSAERPRHAAAEVQPLAPRRLGGIRLPESLREGVLAPPAAPGTTKESAHND